MSRLQELHGGLNRLYRTVQVSDEARARADELVRIKTANGKPLSEWAHELLNTLGGEADRCKARNCGRAIWWFKSRRQGRPVPYRATLEPHWADCPSAEEFRRRREAASRG